MTNALLIEDNEDNIVSMTILLNSGGFQVNVAMTGLDGVNKAISELPEVILLDIQLPDINGFEVLNRLQDSESVRDIPVIAITSNAMAGDREKLLSAGCTGYIEKPIDPLRIVDQIKHFLKD